MGTYIKNNYEDRVVEFPNRFMETDNGNGTVLKTRDEGFIINEGTPITVNKLNNLENGILSAHNQIDGNSTSQHPESIQTQVNAAASKTKLIKVELPQMGYLLVEFSEKLMPGQYLRFVVRGYDLTLNSIDESEVRFNGNKLRASRNYEKFKNENFETPNFAHLIDNDSADPSMLAYGELTIDAGGELFLSVYQTMSPEFDDTCGNFVLKSIWKCETSYINGISQLRLSTGRNNYNMGATCFFYSDTDGELSCRDPYALI